MGNDSSKEQKDDDSSEDGLFSFCLGPRNELKSAPKRRNPVESTALVLDDEMKDGKKTGSSAVSAASRDTERRKSEQLQREPKENKIDRRLTWAANAARSIRNFSSEDDQMKDMEEEAEFYRSQLRKLKSKESSRSLFMKEPPVPTDDTILQKEFEIQNLKKDLYLTQLQREMTLNTLKVALSKKDGVSDKQEIETAKTQSTGIDGSGEDDSNSFESKEENGEEKVEDQDLRKEKEEKRKSHNDMISTLDKYLLENSLSVDEYAMAIMSLSNSMNEFSLNKVKEADLEGATNREQTKGEAPVQNFAGLSSPRNKSVDGPKIAQSLQPINE